MEYFLEVPLEIIDLAFPLVIESDNVIGLALLAQPLNQGLDLRVGHLISSPFLMASIVIPT